VQEEKGMEHRRFLAHPEAHRRFVGRDIFARIGGAAAIEALIGLYDRIEVDPVLQPLFGRYLTNEREVQKRFLAEWLRGERGYSDRAHLPLKHRHDLLPITRALAGRWLAQFRSSLDSTVSDGDARRAIYDDIRLLAMALVNEGEPISALRARPHGTCLRYEPAVESLGLARRGDTVELDALLKRAPDLLASVPQAAALLHVASLAGRTAVVELLLRSAVDVNKPSPIEPLIFATALRRARQAAKRCGARSQPQQRQALVEKRGGLHQAVALNPSGCQLNRMVHTVKLSADAHHDRGFRVAEVQASTTRHRPVYKKLGRGEREQRRP
jgi:truncated hemoglobin YjbI